MKYGMIVVAIATTGLATAIQAEPSEGDIGMALVTMQGEYAPSADAVTLESCARVDDQPGYVCDYRIDECFGEDETCDNPDIVRRAAFVGGDNGWLAFDPQYSEDSAIPRTPMWQDSREMSNVTERWLEGSWNPQGNCENDATFFLARGRGFSSMSEAGRWALEDSDLVITLTASGDDEGSDILPLAEPRVTRWTIYWLGMNVGSVTTPDGETVQMVRCS